VVVHTTMSVTGRPAQFGRGVMAEVGGRIIERFAANLAALLAGEGPPAAGAASAADAAGAAVPGAPASGAADGAAGSAPAAATVPAAAGGAPGGGTPDSPEVSADGAVPLEELQLPVRAYNSLRRAGIHTVGDLSARTEDDLLAIENLGPQSVREIKQRLAGVGQHLAERGASATVGANGAGPQPGRAVRADGATAQNGAATPGTGQPDAPRAARPPDEDAIDLLSVAGFPVLKRALPVAGVVLVLLLVILGLRGRRRRD